MALRMAFRGREPRVGAGVWLAETAVLVGDVEIEELVSVWFGAVLRGDVGSIRIGARTNLQDLVCVHVTGARPGGPEQADVRVGADVTVGHGAVLHGCRVDDGCLIGMGSVLLDHAWIGTGSIVAAGAVVPPRMLVPPRSFVRGIPARVVGELDDEQARLGAEGAASYLALCSRYRTPEAPAARVPRNVGRAASARARRAESGAVIRRTLRFVRS